MTKRGRTAFARPKRGKTPKHKRKKKKKKTPKDACPAGKRGPLCVGLASFEGKKDPVLLRVDLVHSKQDIRKRFLF